MFSNQKGSLGPAVPDPRDVPEHEDPRAEAESTAAANAAATKNSCARCMGRVQKVGGGEDVAERKMYLKARQKFGGDESVRVLNSVHTGHE